jgi:integrase
MLGQSADRHTLTVDELVLRYLDHASGYYQKNGRATSEMHILRAAVRPLVKLFGPLRATEFSPLKLKSVREAMIGQGWSRGTINAAVHRIRRLFRWAVENELLPTEVLTALESVAALKSGRTTAPDRPPVPPVADAAVEATLPHLSPIVADMIRLQRLSGMRPSEVCLLRPVDLDRSGDVWKYIPAEHKTQHRGKQRVIFIGRRGQAILLPYLLRSPEAYCFSPAESERKRRQARHEARVTPATFGNSPGTNVKESPSRTARDRYDANTFRRAIERACDKAFPTPSDLTIPRGVTLPQAEEAKRQKLIKEWRAAHRWAPNQLRHAAATEIRKQFGLEAAQVALGHSEANTTQIYAERDMQKAAEIAKQIG